MTERGQSIENNENSAFNLHSSKRTGTLKRTQAEIRNKIQVALAKRPMGIHEIAQDQHPHGKSVKRHLDHLILIGIVDQFEKAGRTFYRSLK